MSFLPFNPHLCVAIMFFVRNAVGAQQDKRHCARVTHHNL